MAEDIHIRQIQPGDKFSGLSLGHPDFVPLKTFLSKHAQSYQKQNLAKTYGAFQTDTKKLVAYITLVCGQIEAESSEELGVTDFTHSHCPAIKIARLAVDKRFQRIGLGRHLVDFSLGVARTYVSKWVGCRFVVVDSKQQAVKFYKETCGFVLLGSEANLKSESPILFYDLSKVPPKPITA